MNDKEFLNFTSEIYDTLNGAKQLIQKLKQFRNEQEEKMTKPQLPNPELCCYCVDRRPHAEETYHLYLKLCYLHPPQEGFEQGPPGFRQYELGKTFYSHKEAIKEGEEMVRVFSLSDISLVHKNLYIAPVFKEEEEHWNR